MEISYEITAGIVIQVVFQTNILFPRFDINQFQRFPDSVLQFKWRLFQLNGAGFDFGKIKNVINQLEQSLAAAVDDIHIFFLIGFDIRLRQQVGKPQNGIHGGADFMAHHGQKFTLGQTRRIGNIFGFDQLDFITLAFNKSADAGGNSG